MWVVILRTDPDGIASVFGPFSGRPEADRFAAFVTAEVDLATVHALFSPVTELLNWRDVVKAEEGR